MTWHIAINSERIRFNLISLKLNNRYNNNLYFHYKHKSDMENYCSMSGRVTDLYIID